MTCFITGFANNDTIKKKSDLEFPLNYSAEDSSDPEYEASKKRICTPMRMLIMVIMFWMRVTLNLILKRKLFWLVCVLIRCRK
jgi:hypothetical protein